MPDSAIDFKDRNVCAVGAAGATVFLENGHRFLDFASGGWGHGSEEVIEAAFAQMRETPLSTRYFLSRPLAEISRHLAALSPGGLEVSYLCNSGTEAVEGALKLACGFHRNRRRFLCLEGAYHGSTLGALSVCGVGDLSAPFSELPLEAVVASDVTALSELVDSETAAVIVEPWPGGEGMPVARPGWLRTLAERCVEAGALLIADEIRTGLGRAGRMFGIEWEGVVPDVMVLGGVLGGGVVPLAGYVATHRVNDRVYARRDPTLHASATGGNPVGCATGLKILQLLESPEFLASLEDKAILLRDGLEGIALHHPDSVRAVRGAGLSMWLELHDPTLVPALRARAWQGGLAFGRAPGVEDGTVRLFPPLLVSTKEIRRGIEILESAVTGSVEERALA